MMKNWSYINWSFNIFLLLIISCNRPENINNNLEETLVQYLSQEKIPTNSIIFITGTKETLCGSCIKASNTILLKLFQQDNITLENKVSIILIGSSEKSIKIYFGSTMLNKSYVYSKSSDNIFIHKLIKEKPRVYFFKKNEIESFIDIDESNIDIVIDKIQSKL